jgi:hypothetical protein
VKGRIVHCIIPGCPGVAAARGKLFCPDHLSLLPWDRQERLHVLRKGWRPNRLQRSIGAMPPPDGWEKAAHRTMYPEAPGLVHHPYTRWYVAAFACTVWVLIRLWEGVFPLPQAVPVHAQPYEFCPCPLCAHARAVALKALERRG